MSKTWAISGIVGSFYIFQLEASRYSRLSQVAIFANLVAGLCSDVCSEVAFPLVRNLLGFVGVAIFWILIFVVIWLFAYANL